MTKIVSSVEGRARSQLSPQVQSDRLTLEGLADAPCCNPFRDFHARGSMQAE